MGAVMNSDLIEQSARDKADLRERARGAAEWVEHLSGALRSTARHIAVKEFRQKLEQVLWAESAAQDQLAQFRGEEWADDLICKVHDLSYSLLSLIED